MARTSILVFLTVTAAAIAVLPQRPPTSEAAADIREYRYTGDGWTPLSELSANPYPVDAWRVAEVRPLTVATLQLLAGLWVLMWFDRGGWRSCSHVVR